jgi:SulP family sulfate permease
MTKGRGNRECIAQGGANVLKWIFFGEVSYDSPNTKTFCRVSSAFVGIVAALTILVIILFERL